MTSHQNLIVGAWVGDDFSPNINPSNVNAVVGEYARAPVRFSVMRCDVPRQAKY
jgi:hypothetical protein